MKRSILNFILLSVSLFSCAQQEKEYSIPEFRLPVKIPTYFTVQDSFPSPRFLDSNNNVISDTAELKSLKAKLWKVLLIITSGDEKNSMSFNIIPENSQAGNIDKYYEFSKTMQEFNLKQSKNKYDTIVKNFAVGNVQLRKFITVSDYAGSRYFSGFYIGQLNNSFFFAKIDYTDAAIGGEFENIIKSIIF